MNILLLSGSFHSKSYTKALAKIIMLELKPTCNIQSYPIERLPFYYPDNTGDDKPAVVKDFIDKVMQADALIICTPEYNHSIPAVLKNAVDWASRPAFQSPLKGKPVTFFTQARNLIGGARAQAHLKLILDSTLSVIYPCHEQMIAQVHEKFNAAGQLIDSKVLARIQLHLTEFIQWAKHAGNAVSK